MIDQGEYNRVGLCHGCFDLCHYGHLLHFQESRMNCDYLVVGAGAAGCVVSNRLSHSPNNTVICIEAGGKDTNVYIKIPAGFSKTVYDDKINWPYYTEETDNTANRKIRFPRGKVLGGSSSVSYTHLTLPTILRV